MLPNGADRHSWQKELAKSAMPPTTKLIGHSIALYSGPTGRQGAWLSSSDLRKLASLRSLNTVNVHLRSLRELGWIHSEDGALYLDYPAAIQPAPA